MGIVEALVLAAGQAQDQLPLGRGQSPRHGASAIAVLNPADGIGLIAAFEALHLTFTQLQQAGGFAYAQPPAHCILNHFHPLELFLTHRHHPYRVTKSRCSYGVTLSWSIYISPSCPCQSAPKRVSLPIPFLTWDPDMSSSALLQYAAFLLAVTLLVKPVGRYMARVFSAEKTLLDPLLCPVERWLYRLTGVKRESEMGWQEYASAFVVFGMVGTLLLYAILRLQRLLPWFYPAYMTTPMTPDLAMNTAVSFATTTTWQAYGGETTLSYFSQIVGLTLQNFLAGAAGLAVGVAFVRGLARDRAETLGNFWVDLVRSILWVLLPLSIVGALVLAWQGVPMNFHPYTQATALDGSRQSI